MARLRLVSHHLCPYVQRAAIALAEKSADYERIYVDLTAKPARFKAMSPLGKVPLLDVGGRVIFESAVILEYLEDTVAPALHPANPLRRAEHRSWIEFGSAVLNDIAGLYNAVDAASFAIRRDGLASRFARLEERLVAAPWFDGEDFSLVDAAFAPVFRYFDAFDRLGVSGILDTKPKLAGWRAGLAQRSSVIGAVAADYPERLMAFLAARGSHISALKLAA